jgi:hypothetical protein
MKVLFTYIVIQLMIGLGYTQMTFAAPSRSSTSLSNFEYDTQEVAVARKKVAAACRQNRESKACRGSIAYCKSNPYDRFCGRGGRTDCSLFPFLKECGGTQSPGASVRPDLICQQYPFSPVCTGNGNSCRFLPNSIGCRDGAWGGYGYGGWGWRSGYGY